MGDRPKGLDLPDPLPYPLRASTPQEMAHVDAMLRLYEQIMLKRRRPATPTAASERQALLAKRSSYEQRQQKRKAEIALIRDLADVRTSALAFVDGFPREAPVAGRDLTPQMAALLKDLVDTVEGDVVRLLGYPPWEGKGPGEITVYALRAALDEAGRIRGVDAETISFWYSQACTALWGWDECGE